MSHWEPDPKTGIMKYLIDENGNILFDVVIPTGHVSHSSSISSKEPSPDEIIPALSNLSKDLRAYFPVWKQGIILEVNANGTYDVLIKGRDYAYEEVNYLGNRKLFENDCVIVGFYCGDRQMPFILDFSGHMSSAEIVDYIQNAAIMKWSRPYDTETATSTNRGFTRSLAFESHEEEISLLDIDPADIRTIPNPPGKVDVIDDAFGYAIAGDQNCTVYKLNIDVAPASIDVIESKNLYIDILQAIEIIGISSKFLYARTDDLKKIYAIDKGTLLVYSSTVIPFTPDGGVMWDTFGCDSSTAYIWIYEKHLGVADYVYYIAKLRIYSANLGKYEDYDLPLYRYIEGGPYYWHDTPRNYTWAYAGKTFGQIYPYGIFGDFIKVYIVPASPPSTPLGPCYNFKTGAYGYYTIDVPYSQYENQWYYDVDAEWLNGIPEDKKFIEENILSEGSFPPYAQKIQSLSNSDYIVSQYENGTKLICFDKVHKKTLWTYSNTITTGTFTSDELLFFDPIYSPFSGLFGHSIRSWNYFQTIKSMNLLCMTDDYIFIQERELIHEPIYWNALYDYFYDWPNDIYTIPYNANLATIALTSITHRLLILKVVDGTVYKTIDYPADHNSTVDRILYGNANTITINPGLHYTAYPSHPMITACRGNILAMNNMINLWQNVLMFECGITLGYVPSYDPYYEYAMYVFDIDPETLWIRTGNINNFLANQMIWGDNLYCAPWINGAFVNYLFPYDLETGTNVGVLTIPGLPENACYGSMKDNKFSAGFSAIFNNSLGICWSAHP